MNTTLNVNPTVSLDETTSSELQGLVYKTEVTRRKKQTAFSSEEPLGHSNFWHPFKHLAQTLGANLAPFVQGGIKVRSPWHT